MTNTESELKFTIRRSQRAKKTRIVVTTEKIEVVAPENVSERKIDDFVQSQKNWIVNAIEKLEYQKKQVVDLAPKIYKDGVKVPFRGEKFTLKLKLLETKEINIRLIKQKIEISYPVNLKTVCNSEMIKQLLIDWMQAQLRVDIDRIIEHHAPKFNLFPRHIRIKTQKSRWGSCGIHNDINLNWLLILAPPEVLEYVVVHEICHIKERNHSSRFWALVEAHLAHYLKPRNWLKEHGASIMRGL